MKNQHFNPAWWLPSGHLQTIYPKLKKRYLSVMTQRERFELPDGDFIDIDWAGDPKNPIVIVLHGLGGSLASPYATGIVEALVQANLCVAFMHFRGCSGEPNRLHQTYHSGETGDIRYITTTIKKRYPHQPLFAIGYSMGANILLKWLGETGENTLLSAAVGVSVPFDLANAATRMQQGLSQLYQKYLLAGLHDYIKRKFKRLPPPINVESIESLDSFWLFDDKITAPLHGFADVHDYYRQSSCRQYLRGINIPTLIIHARDDPFMTPAAIPLAHEVSSSVHLEILDKGGHVGFIEGSHPWKSEFWLEKRIPIFLNSLSEGPHEIC